MISLSLSLSVVLDSHSALLQTDARLEANVGTINRSHGNGDGRLKCLTAADLRRVGDVCANHHSRVVDLRIS